MRLWLSTQNFKKVNIEHFEFDIGNFINREHFLKMYKALKQPQIPENSYNFKKDSSDGNCSFYPQWLTEYLLFSTQ